MKVWTFFGSSSSVSPQLDGREANPSGIPDSLGWEFWHMLDFIQSPVGNLGFLSLHLRSISLTIFWEISLLGQNLPGVISQILRAEWTPFHDPAGSEFPVFLAFPGSCCSGKNMEEGKGGSAIWGGLIPVVLWDKDSAGDGIDGITPHPPTGRENPLCPSKDDFQTTPGVSQIPHPPVPLFPSNRGSELCPKIRLQFLRPLY